MPVSSFPIIPPRAPRVPKPWQQESTEDFIAPYILIEQRCYFEEIPTWAEAKEIIRAQDTLQPVIFWWSPRMGKTGACIMFVQERDAVIRHIQSWFGIPQTGSCVLVICPPPLMPHWSGVVQGDAEVQMWTTWEMGKDIISLRGGKEKRLKLLRDAAINQPKMIVIPYSWFQSKFEDKADELRLLMEVNIDVVAFDEAHAVSNGRALKSRLIRRLPMLEFCLIIQLTGTPITNRVDKLHNPMSLAFPGPLKIKQIGPRGGEHYIPITQIPWDQVKDQAFSEATKRDVSPAMQSYDEFVKTYTQTKTFRGKQQVTEAKNLNVSTCRACSWSRCNNVTSPSTGRKGACPHLQVEVAVRIPKFCNNCPLYIPMVCQTCTVEPGPLFLKLERLGVDRRNADDYLSSGHKSYENVIVDMTASQAELYKAVKAGVVEWRDSQTGIGKKINQQTILAILNSLRTVASDPEQWYRGWLARKGGELGADFFDDIKPPKDKRSGKVEYLKNFVENELGEEHKILIFTEWSRTVSTLVDELSDLKPVGISGELTGTPEKFEAAKREFNEDPACRAWISTSKSIEGIDLSAGGATRYVFLFNPSWTPRFSIQASERATNMNYHHPINILTLLSRGTIDASIQMHLAAKAREMDLAIDDSLSGVAETFDSGDIQDILDALEINA